jgi:hypothetical protein
MSMSKTLLAIVLMLGLLGAILPQPVSAHAVDEWRVLHIGLESAASKDTDGNGTINRWQDCRPLGTAQKTHCKPLHESRLYQMWQTDLSCFESTIEGWSNQQIDIVQDQIFIETDDVLDANPYDFHWSGYSGPYNFNDYDVVMVWTAYTQKLGADGLAWYGPTSNIGNYGFVAVYGLAGHCDLAKWPGIVAPHEFTHIVTALYRHNGFPVCGTYNYPGGHAAIYQNTHAPVTCTFGPTKGQVSTGIPLAAFASGSLEEHYP